MMMNIVWKIFASTKEIIWPTDFIEALGNFDDFNSEIHWKPSIWLY